MSQQPLEHRRARWGRRALTIPAVVLSWALAVLALVALPLVVLIDLWRGSRLALTRAQLVVLGFLSLEVLGLIAAGALTPLKPCVSAQRWIALNAGLQRHWVEALIQGLRTIYGVTLRVEIEGAPDRREALVVLVRHVSRIDTLLPLHALAGWRLRYVLKRELLWDPCLDLVGQRLPNAFVRRGSGDTEGEVARIAELALGLGPGDGVVLFPEGTRFSSVRRQHVLASLERAGRLEAAARARRLDHVLPPRLGGASTLLAAAPQAGVLLLNHTGLERVNSLSDLLAGALIGLEIRLRLDFVPADRVPRSEEALEEWIWEAWTGVDTWLASQPARSAQPQPVGLASRRPRLGRGARTAH